MSLRALVHRHDGRSAVVIGGGPSGPWACIPFFGGMLPTDPVVFSANDHGYRFPGFPPVDYMVACDQIEGRLRAHDAPVIGPKIWADYRVFEKPVHSSGMLAAYCAWVMGCSPIVLVGMDCYAGGTYFWDEEHQSAGNGKALDVHLGRWAVLLDAAPGITVRATAGPLLDLFPRYDPAEPRIPVATSREAMEKLVAGVTLRFTKPENFRGRIYKPGDVDDFTEGEARNLQINDKAVPL